MQRVVLEYRETVPRRVYPLADGGREELALACAHGQVHLHRRDDAVGPGDPLQDAHDPHVVQVDALVVQRVGALSEAADDEELRRAGEHLPLEPRAAVPA